MHDVLLRYMIEETDLIPLKALSWMYQIDEIKTKNISRSVKDIMFNEEIPLELRKRMRKIIEETIGDIREYVNRQKQDKGASQEEIRENVKEVIEKMKIRLKEEIVNYYLEKLPETKKEEMRKKDKMIDLYMDVNGI